MPNKEYPIVQSYVDIFISGCLEIEDKYELPHFADKCVETTKGWSTSWVNDRLYPRRPIFNVPKAFRIDKVLANNVPKQFGKIEIEGWEFWVFDLNSK